MICRDALPSFDVVTLSVVLHMQRPRLSWCELTLMECRLTGRSSWAFRQNSTGKGLVAPGLFLWPVVCTWAEEMWALEQLYCPGSLCVSCGPYVAHPVIKLRLSWYLFHSQWESGIVVFSLLAVRESVMNWDKSLRLINCWSFILSSLICISKKH